MKGPLYLHIEFETNWTLLPEDVAVSNPMGNQHRHWAYENIHVHSHTEMVCYEVLQVESRYHLPFWSYSDLNERHFYNNFPFHGNDPISLWSPNLSIDAIGKLIILGLKMQRCPLDVLEFLHMTINHTAGICLRFERSTYM